MSRVRGFLALALISLASGCSGMNVSVDYGPAGDLSAYRTYGWIEAAQPSLGDTRFDDAALDSRVRQAVERELASRGYEKAASSGGPQLLVAYTAALHGKTTVQQVRGTDPRIRAPWSPLTGEYTSGEAGLQPLQGNYQKYEREYDKGTLVIDILDARSGELIWRASAQAEVDVGADPGERGKRIDKGIHEMLERLPKK